MWPNLSGLPRPDFPLGCRCLPFPQCKHGSIVARCPTTTLPDSHDQCTQEQLEVASRLSRVTQRCEKLLSCFIAPFDRGLPHKFIHLQLEEEYGFQGLIYVALEKELPASALRLLMGKFCSWWQNCLEHPRCLSQRQHMAREASECRWLLNKQASQECCVISAPAAAPLSRQHSRSRCSLPTLARFNQRFCAGAIKAGRALRPNPFLPPILTWWEVIWPFLPVVLPVNIPRGLGSLDAQLTSTCSLNTSNYPIVVTCRDPISSTNRLTHTHKERKRVCGQRLF